MAQLMSKNRSSHRILFSMIFNPYRLPIMTRVSSHLSNSNEQNSSFTLFSLFAPTVAEVNLVSSFSNWTNIPMKKDINTGVFQIPSYLQISDGEHEYKYLVRKHAGQKYSTSVIDPYVEKYDAKRRFGLITIQNRKKYRDIYEWKYDHIKLPENNQLIIYELYVADFTENGQFSGVLSKLDHLIDLGINAIELMPIQGIENKTGYYLFYFYLIDYMGNEHDWGYSPTHHFALKATYGTKNDLKKLVDECHKRGIRVILDGVFNHSSLSCPLVLIDRHYWVRQLSILV